MSSRPPPSADELPGLLARIRAEFPHLDFNGARLNQTGADHWVVILDERWLFRFPRGAWRLAPFRVELAVLARLWSVSPIPVPRYEHVSRDEDFGGYRMIDGVPLRPAIFSALAPAVRTAILERVAKFLHVMHALPPEIIREAGGEVARDWAGDRGWIAERRALVATFVAPELLARMDSFFDVLAAAPGPPRQVLIHGDLTDDHLLLSPTEGRVAGLIDFGDAAVGDPAYDLAFFFAYGEEAALQIVALYDPETVDPGLFGRARVEFTRYRIDQLWWGAMGFAFVDRQTVIDALPGLLGTVR